MLPIPPKWDFHLKRQHFGNDKRYANNIHALVSVAETMEADEALVCERA